eukprot:9489862-Pyramimonas_sp.AAC.1
MNAELAEEVMVRVRERVVPQAVLGRNIAIQRPEELVEARVGVGDAGEVCVCVVDLLLEEPPSSGNGICALAA